MQMPVKTRSSQKTPSRSASKSNRNSYLHGATDEAELGGGDDEDDEPSNRGDPDDLVKDYIRHLSFDKSEEDNTQYLQVRSHSSLDKIRSSTVSVTALTRPSSDSRGSSMR
ncbi:hypothetical protein PI125_g12023 [Phytophthora idaei]|nr:hypothetical protein PI125_g12023 [Phytophthora idaei]KAG3149509.1 hypothetical protein PI126_g11984 [Phytophthora idaei]